MNAKTILFIILLIWGITDIQSFDRTRRKAVMDHHDRSLERDLQDMRESYESSTDPVEQKALTQMMLYLLERYGPEGLPPRLVRFIRQLPKK